MQTLLLRDISDMTYDEIESLKLTEYSAIEHSKNDETNYMYVVPTEQQANVNGEYKPVKVFANKHKEPLTDKAQSFRSLQECSVFCAEKNKKLGHTIKSMFMILESIRLEELLRKKLRLEGELKIKSDYVIRESAGFKFILFDKGNGIITTASINDALNNGLAAIKREEQKAVKKEEVKTKAIRNTRHDYNW